MSLTISYLGKLTVAEHDGIARQILGKLQGSSLSNELFTQSLNGYATCVQAEDDAYTHSLKDFNTDRLKAEDDIVDAYVKAVRAILNGYSLLPESEAKHQPAVELLQVFKDYNFNPSDSYTAESDKIRNMNQVFQPRIADLQALGIAEYWAQAVTHAATVEQLLSQRFDDIAARVVGELKTARANTDEALKRVYEVLTAMNVMMPSTELNNLIAQLEAIESYAIQYYLGGKKPANNTTNTTDTGENQGGENGSNGSSSSSGSSDSGSGTGTGTGTGSGTGDPSTGGSGQDNGGTPPGDDDDKAAED